MWNKDKQPMKRYLEYKDSGVEWIGEIPEGWNSSRLKYILTDKVTDGPHETPSFIEEGIPFLSVDGIQNGELIFEGCRFVSLEDHERFSRKCKVEKDNILMGKAASIGKIARVKVDFEFSIWSPLALLKPKMTEVNPVFLEYALKSSETQYQVEILCTSNTQKNISMDDIHLITITLPPLSEQQTIATYLDRKTHQIDTLIENKQKLIDLLKEQRAAIINHAVTKGLNPNVKLKDSGIEWLGEIPEHWDVKKLKYFAMINPTKDNSLLSKDSGTLVTFLPMEMVNEDGTFITDMKKPIKELWNGFTYFEENDTIVAKITPCFENGKGAFLENLDSMIGFGSTEFYVLREIPDVSTSKYLYYITRTNLFRKMGEAFMTGAAGQKRVPTNFIADFIIGLPSVDEQREITDYLDEQTTRMDKSIEKQERQIDHLKEYRTALISEVVTGKIDVRDSGMQEVIHS